MTGELSPDGWSLDRVLRGGRITLERLRALGVRVPADNRLERACHYLAAAMQVPVGAMTGEEHALVGESVHTIFEQYLIVRAMTRAGHEVQDRLRRLLEGGDLPGMSSHTEPRDTQFELAVGALLWMGGVKGVRFGEPDWRIQAGPSEIGIAVKRLSSRRNRFKRVRDAVDQIHQQAIPGVVILSLDGISSASTEAEANANAQEVVKEFKEVAIVHNSRCTNDGVVLGVVGFATGFEEVVRDGAAAITLWITFHAEFLVDSLARAPSIHRVLSGIAANAKRDLIAAFEDSELAS